MNSLGAALQQLGAMLQAGQTGPDAGAAGPPAGSAGGVTSTATRIRDRTRDDAAASASSVGMRLIARTSSFFTISSVMVSVPPRLLTA